MGIKNQIKLINSNGGKGNRNESNMDRIRELTKNLIEKNGVNDKLTNIYLKIQNEKSKINEMKDENAKVRKFNNLLTEISDIIKRENSNGKP